MACCQSRGVMDTMGRCRRDLRRGANVDGGGRKGAAERWEATATATSKLCGGCHLFGGYRSTIASSVRLYRGALAGCRELLVKTSSEGEERSGGREGLVVERGEAATGGRSKTMER
jgi:hypothetical protein